MEVGPTGAQFGNSDPNDERYSRNFNGRDIVRRCHDAKGEYLVVWARDGDFAYYDSKLIAKPKALRNRDPLREAVLEARRLNLPLIAYCVVQQEGHFLNDHPEFRMRDRNGRPLRLYCYNSGYLNVMKQLVEEQLAYGIDGFHIDMLDQGFGPPHGCWCEHCREKFEAEYKQSMPSSPTWDANWDRMLDFRYRSSDQFEKELAAHIKKLNPLASVDFNYHGNPPFSWEVGQLPVKHALNGDFVTGETGVWGFSALTVGLNAEFYRAAAPGKRFQVAINRAVRNYHDQTTRPLIDIRWELFTLLSHGAFVTLIDKTAFDGSLDPVVYERTGAAFAEAIKKREHFGQTPHQVVGIWFSSRSRDWIGREQPGEWFRSFLGAHKAMVFEHIPWGILLDENANRTALQKFRIVLLPNVGILAEDECVLLREYVENGGNVIATGLGGCFDKYGNLQNKSTIELLIGARFVRMLDSLDNWVKFSQPFGEVRSDWPFLVQGPAAVWQPTKAKPLGELLKPFRTIQQMQGRQNTDLPMSSDIPVGPALFVNQLGRGKVLTFACSPDYATASEYSIIEARKLLIDAIKMLDPQPKITISAPANVEAVVTEDTEQRVLRIHFVGYNAPPQTIPAKGRPRLFPALIEDPPRFRACVTLQDTILGVDKLNASTKVDVARNRVDLQIDDVHEVLLIRH